jgi:hypothetical protein
MLDAGDRALDGNDAEQWKANPVHRLLPRSTIELRIGGRVARPPRCWLGKSEVGFACLPRSNNQL